MHPLQLLIGGLTALGLAFTAQADPQAVAARVKGDWNAETGVWHKRLGPVDAAALAELAADPAVKTIHLDGVKLDLAAMEALGTAKTLQTLLIVHTDVGDLAMLRELAKIQSLTDLHVGSSVFGDDGLRILSGLKNLKSLRIRHVSRDPARPITAVGLKAIADALPDLEVLYINLHQMDDEMIPQLARLTKLRQLMLEWVSPGFLAKVKAALPKTNVIHTGGFKAPEKGSDPNFPPPFGQPPNRPKAASTLPIPPAPKKTAATPKGAPHHTDDLWSLQPVNRPSVPQLDSKWPRTDVDAFLLAQLEVEKLTPSPDAAPAAFARRLWLVLTGLPPTPEEVQRFQRAMIEDDAEAFLGRTVDELLASPRFAEKWARHWLDVARYAESNGKALNNGLPYAWRYRDWVIAAIHADKPVDRFLTEQLAGDLLAEADERSNPVPSPIQQGLIDQLNIATGFLAIGSKEQFGGCGSRSVAEVQPEWVDDQLNVLGRGLLGLNISCSRCHDHKFDPVPMRDYYALAGIFFSTDIQSGIKGGKAPEFGIKRILDPDAIPLGDPAALEKLRPVAAQLAELQKKMTPLQNKLDQAKGAARDKLFAQLDPLKEEAEKLRSGIPEIEWAFGLRDSARIADTTLRQRGIWNQHGPEIPRGFLSAVAFDGTPSIPAGRSGRLELAQWLTHPRHPLTARVFVNRVWHHVFGRGLVPTTDNFGVNGEPPSHPELLDFLAHRFIHEQHWSLKQLVRDLVLSRAFRQSSAAGSGAALAADPSNRLLWRMNPRRLDAEQLRDGILFTAGQLDLTPRRGTSPLLMEKRFGGLNQKDLAKLRESESQLKHRAIYLTIVRNETLDDTLAAFDFPNNDEPATQREAATVPAQTLLLMNQPLVLAAARHLAAGIQGRTSDAEDCAREAFLRVLSREPAESEIQAAVRFLEPGGDSLALLCQGLFQTAEFRLLP